MTYEPTGLDRFAKFDPSISRSRIANSAHVPSWLTVFVRLLQKGDWDAAHFVRAHVREAEEVERLQLVMRKTDYLMTTEEMAGRL